MRACPALAFMHKLYIGRTVTYCLGRRPLTLTLIDVMQCLCLSPTLILTTTMPRVLTLTVLRDPDLPVEGRVVVVEHFLMMLGAGSGLGWGADFFKLLRVRSPYRQCVSGVGLGLESGVGRVRSPYSLVLGLSRTSLNEM